MPSTYAHYRFGCAAADMLTGESAKAVRHFRSLFEVGLHGPDLFFYYNPLFHTRVGQLGYTYHRMTGKQFFEQSAQMLRQSPSEGGTAYLYGVLGHYALDSACHSFIRASSDGTVIRHVQLESEFDRFLLELDGKKDPHLLNTGAHLTLSRGGAQTVATFYPPATSGQILAGLRNMKLVSKAIASPHRRLVQTIFRFGGPYAPDMILQPQADTGCCHLDAPLLELYEKGLDAYSGMARQLDACLQEGTPLDDLFANVFE